MQLALEAGSALGADSKTTAMPSRSDNQPRVILPAWVLPLLVTLLLAFLTNLSYSFYWAGQMASKQEAAEQRQIKMQADIERLTLVNQDLRERLAAIAARQVETRSRD